MVCAATLPSCGQSVNCMNTLQDGPGERPHLSHTCAGASRHSREDRVSKGGLSGVGHWMGL